MSLEYYDLFEYDVALSFAAEDRSAAEELGRLLAARNLKVLYDEYMAGEAPGTDWVDHLVNIYARKARYCVMLISKSYPLRKWTEAERKSARERALRDANEYIVPLRLDDTEVPGLSQSAGTMDLGRDSVESIAGALEERLKKTKHRPGPPARSHDLRSGNVPSSGTGPEEE